jgi:hypothetical protein
MSDTEVKFNVSKIAVSGSIHVLRDGKTVRPTKGKPFLFSAAEVADIERLNPGAIRDAVNEGEAPAEAASEDGKKPAKGKPAPSKDDDDL